MRIVDARRLRGPSLGASGPGAMVEVALQRGETARRSAIRWKGRVGSVLSCVDVDLHAYGLAARARAYRGGLALFVPAPVDLLDPMLELAEWAVESATRSMRGEEEILEAPHAVQRFRPRFATAKNVRLRKLAVMATSRRVPFLFDDESVTVGHASTARTYALDAIPTAARVPWLEIARVPVALVTGTNGKTTTTRMVARIAKHAGLVVGSTTSDGTAIDEVIVEPGDNTGGESARAVLRDPRTEIAILETARGGLLRRGLAVTDVDAALITNVTPDHLGEHGVFDLETLVRTKAIVAQAVRRSGVVVLGADDPSLVRLAREVRRKRAWFALAPFASRDPIFTVVDGAITRIQRGLATPIVRIDDVPVTDGGRAMHNVENALAAAALAWALRLPDDAIAAGLRSFGAIDNPGRGKIETTASGVRVVLDFGHNPAAAKELYAWAHALAGAHRVHAVLTQPGDRTNAAIADFARAVASSGVADAFVWETESLLRGRERGDIVRQLIRALRARKTKVTRAADEADAVRRAIARAKAGDVVVVSPSLDRAVPRHDA